MTTVKTELKKIDFAQKEFTANGKTYFIESSYSYDRYRMWKKLQVEIGFGSTFTELFDSLIRIYSHCNKPQPEPVDAGMIAYNQAHAIKNAMNDRYIEPVMQMCALFMNTKDEDRRYITLQQIQDKVNDWNEEGIDMDSFFTFAISLIPNFLKHFASITPDTLEEQVTKK